MGNEQDISSQETIVPDTGKRSIKVINRDMLKYMALFLMGVGHEIMFIGFSHFKTWPVLILRFFIFGQFFAPQVFFFFISEGFTHTRSRKKYIIRLLIFTLITQVPFYLCNLIDNPWWTIFTKWSVLASLLAGLLVLTVWETKWKLPVRILVMAAITGATALIQAEWMIMGPILIFLYYILKDKPIIRFIVVEIALAVYQLCINGFNLALSWGAWGYWVAGSVALLVITFFYNGRKGHFPVFSKWVFYVFYPLHLLIPFILKTFFNF